MSAKRVESGSLGKLPPRHTFALNPRQSARVGRCPDCRAPTEALTLPLPLRIEPDVRIAIRIKCRYSPHCDLLIGDGIG